MMGREGGRERDGGGNFLADLYFCSSCGCHKLMLLGGKIPQVLILMSVISKDFVLMSRGNLNLGHKASLSAPEKHRE